MDTVQNIALCFTIALLVNVGAAVIDSTFIDSFMSDRLLIVLISLMAINVTTSSVLMTKLREIVDATGGDFPKSVREIKKVFTEYLVMISLAFVFSVAKGSVMLTQHIPYFDFAMDVLLTSIFAYAIYVLYDLAQSIFILLDYEHGQPVP